MAAKIFRINYKSDFILTLNSDAGWMTPFCIKFWTGAPSQAYFVGWDGTTYTHCAYDPSEPTKLLVQFDDHHLPIGDLKFQIAYHFTVADFPNDTEDEVINPANITTEIDGHEYQVMLDFTGETAPEIQFALPAYYNEQERIENEQRREQEFAEMQRENEQAVQGAENVNAQLDGTILTVTNRNGQRVSKDVRGPQGNGIESAVLNDDYTLTLHYTNGTSYTTPSIRGAIGVGIANIHFKEQTVNGDNIYTVTMTDGSTYDITAPMGPASKADINLNGSVITVTNNAGVSRSIDLLDATNERVQIVVTTDVAGVIVSGLVINVYYNGASTPTTTVTTDANGMAVLSVPNGYQYRLVFPSIEGCETPSDVVHTASVSQRSVEVEYVEETFDG